MSLWNIWQCYSCPSDIVDIIIMRCKINQSTDKQNKYNKCFVNRLAVYVQNASVGLNSTWLTCRSGWVEQLIGRSIIYLSTICGSLSPANEPVCHSKYIWGIIVATHLAGSQTIILSIVQRGKENRNGEGQNHNIYRDGGGWWEGNRTFARTLVNRVGLIELGARDLI